MLGGKLANMLWFLYMYNILYTNELSHTGKNKISSYIINRLYYIYIIFICTYVYTAIYLQFYIYMFIFMYGIYYFIYLPHKLYHLF